jgi:hypothetical protein
MSIHVNKLKLIFINLLHNIRYTEKFDTTTRPDQQTKRH